MDEYPAVQISLDDIIEEEEFERLYAAPAEIIVLLSIFYGGISILAVIGNSLVIWVVATTRQMRTVTNLYIANLAFADVIIGVFCIPFQFQAALLQRWNLPNFMCGFCPFIQVLSVNVSVFTLTAIAVDRHRAIINPLRARPSKFASKWIISGIWIIALCFAIPSAIAFRVEVVHERIREDNKVYNVTRPFCNNQNLTEDQLLVYRYALVFVQYLVPFCVISFVYIQMAMKLWGTRTPGNAQDTRDLALLKNKKKVIKMLIIVVIVFGLCWLPLQLYNILYVTIPEINEYHFISIVWFCCDWLAMSNSCYNPFIYGIYNEKFKREFNKRFASCFCKFTTNQDANERTISMHTRASSVRSIRSAYANSSMRKRGGGSVKFGSRTQSFYHKEPIGVVSGIGDVGGGTGAGAFKHFAKKHMNAHSFGGGGVGGGGGIGADVGGFSGGAFYNMLPYAADVAGDYDYKGQPAYHINNKKSNEMTLSAFANGKRQQNVMKSQTAGNRFLNSWRRNHFRPQQPDVIENDDDRILSVGGDVSAPVLSISEHDSYTNSNSDGVFKSDSFRDNASCICELELGSRTECDGTCILNEVSRVRAPSISVLPPSTSSSAPSEHSQAVSGGAGGGGASGDDGGGNDAVVGNAAVESNNHDSAVEPLLPFKHQQPHSHGHVVKKDHQQIVQASESIKENLLAYNSAAGPEDETPLTAYS